ncbi:MAG: hypothetical protein CMK32_04395 [Porticoccaceae bacterium]|nr:hypothetical protein [Porticoccaceae bacterium]
MMSDRKILINGVAGFIGCVLIRYPSPVMDRKVIYLNANAYMDSLAFLAEVMQDLRCQFVYSDIRNREIRECLFRGHRPNAVMHLAAEFHVDRLGYDHSQMFACAQPCLPV